MTGPLDAGLDRRRFLLAAGALGSAGLLGACSEDSPRPPDSQPAVTRADRLEGDLSVAALMASLENLMVAVYDQCLDRQERFGPHPPAALGFFETAQRHHREHALAWNSVLTGAGKPGVTGVNLTVKASTTEPGLVRARDYWALLQLAEDVEGITATTYLHAIGALENNAAIKIAGSIHPVEHEHIGTLSFLLGHNPSSEPFGRSDGARPITDSIG
ncbi:MAG: ferritin-like domain-containing protein [Acidimicrobiia bacterium]